ncbi:DUF4349 domain-containing protein [Alkalibacter mobilis]|uniref:DUF4349 domain-containing protein n=1 Tax=Alkalibacter mobilis TaxID=2787712 RepID=UPI00189CD3CC|nr:DUF4349 domain-containing protein [Alkalibacter mobilis]MBF7096535.1 DUF4349 domain-containing protein [Alkalibacter mobilis]
MDHDKYIDYINRFVDDDLSVEETIELQSHLETCKECSRYFEDVKEFKNRLSSVEEYDMDFDLKKGVMKEIDKGRMKKVNYRKYFPIAAGLILVLFLITPFLKTFLFGSMANQDSAENGGEPAYDYDYDYGDDGKDSDSGGEESRDDSGITLDMAESFDVSKIIYTGSMNLYTEEYQDTMEKIEVYIKSIGGFIQESSSNYYDSSDGEITKSGYVLLRVKSVDFEAAMDTIESYGEAQNSNIRTTNITRQYQDIKGELDSYLIQQERLLEYLEKAEKIEDMLAIEDQLSRVRNEINYRTTMINNWDTQIAYSTIQVNVYEKEVPTTKVKSPFENFGFRIKEAFVQSINSLLIFTSNLLVVLTSLLPYILLIGILGLIGLLIFKNRHKK